MIISSFIVPCLIGSVPREAQANLDRSCGSGARGLSIPLVVGARSAGDAGKWCQQEAEARPDVVADAYAKRRCSEGEPAGVFVFIVNVDQLDDAKSALDVEAVSSGRIPLQCS